MVFTATTWFAVHFNDASVGGNLRSAMSYVLHHMDAHFDAMSAKAVDLAEREVAARNEGYIPSWADDVLAFISGFGVRAHGPKAVHVR